MSKQVKKATAKKQVKPFAPKADLNILERGKEFLALQRTGLNVDDIRDLYKKEHGIKFSTPTFYNAIRLFENRYLVGDAIDSGEVKASEVLPLLQGQSKMTTAAFEAKVQKGLRALIRSRKAKATMLKQSGFAGEGSLKLTKGRKVAMVGQSLQNIRLSGSLKDAGAKAVLEFIEGLKQNQTVEELLEQIGVKQ